MKNHLKFYLSQTPLGWVGLIVSDAGLRSTTLPQPSRSEALRQVINLGVTEPASEGEVGNLPETITALARGELVDLGKIPIDWGGMSRFQRTVLEEAANIPAGETRTYGWLAQKAGHPGAARAVGRALATNPLPLVIPCHRVVASNGTLGGYGGGLRMKATLLEAEAAASKR